MCVITVAVLAVLTIPMVASAQPTTGSARGQVLDVSGGAVPDATVSLMNTDTGASTHGMWRTSNGRAE